VSRPNPRPRCRRRDDEQYVDFVNASQQRLRRTAYLMTGDWQLAADATQEALLRVFMGWEIVTAAGTDLATTAALRSTNGYVATCSLSAVPGHQGDGSYVAIEREKSPQAEGLENEYAVWFSTDQYAGDNQAGDYNVFGVGQVSGPKEAAQIVITEPDGTEHVSEVADNGWFALAEDLHLEMYPHGVSPLHITVLAADGDVLADYPDGEQSSECEEYPELCEGPAD
jgi:hypothetical protein